MRYLLLALTTSLSTYSQDKFTVYFDTDKYVLNGEQQNRLQQFLKNKEIDVKSVTGFCDFRASKAYNYRLGLNRANNILSQLAIEDKNKIAVESKGEEFIAQPELHLNRRVEIIYETVKPTPIVAVKPIEVVEKVVPTEPLKIEPPQEIITSELQMKVNNASVGDKILLKNLNFYVRSEELYPESYPLLDDLVDVLEINPKLKIEIQGHICCTPGRDTEEFSLRRCKTVYNYLVESGIDKSRLSYIGFDATQPIFPIPEKTEEERKANRRVEILILEK